MVPAQRFAGLAGLTNFMGYVGASLGVGPIAVFVKHYGWRTTMAGTGFIAISFIGILICSAQR